MLQNVRAMNMPTPKGRITSKMRPRNVKTITKMIKTHQNVKPIAIQDTKLTRNTIKQREIKFKMTNKMMNKMTNKMMSRMTKLTA